MRFNIRFLSDLIVVCIILTGLTFYAHSYQIRRTCPLMLKLAREAREAGRIGQSAQLYMRYLKLEPDSSEAASELGELAARSGNLEGTYYQLNNSLRLNPDQPQIRGQLAEIAVQLERYPNAKRFLLAETNRDFKQKPRRKWLLGVAEQHLEEFDNARGHLQAAVDAVPDEPAYAQSLADLLTDHFSDAEQGKQVLDRLISEAPENATAYLTRGRWSFQRALKINDHKLAEPLLTAAWDDVQQGIRLEPEKPELAFLAASVATAKGTPEQAREIVTTALAANSKLPELYDVIAQIEMEANDRDLAIDWLNRGLTEIPGHADLLWKLAQLQFDAGNTEAVDEIFEQLRSQNYPEAPILLMEARRMVNRGKIHEAADLLEESSLIFERDRDQLKQADFLLARCYRLLGDSDQQLAALRRVIVLDPQWMPAREALAKALLERGSLPESLSEYKRIFDRSNPSVSAQVGYARLLFFDGLKLAGDNLGGWDWSQLQNVLSTLDSIPEAATDTAVLRAELLAAQGQQQEAEALLRSQIENDNESLLASRTLIKLLREKQDWEQVESVLQLAEQASGDSPTLRLERARYLIDRYGKQATEQPQFGPLAEPQPDWDEVQRAELAVSFAALYHEIEDYPASEKFARVVAESETFQPRLDFYLRLFDSALLSGNTDTMTMALARVRQFKGASPLLQIGEGVRLTIEAEALPETNTTQRASLFEQALAELTKAAVARPTWSRIPRLKGDIYERWGRQELAVRNYLNAINLGDKDPQLISRSVLLLFEQERLVDADKTIRKLQEQNTPLSTELIRTASQVSLQLENFDRARGLAQELVEQSDNAEDRLLLARIFRLSEDFAAAEREFRTAIDIDPAKPDGWVSLVEVLAHQEDIDKARQAIDEARESLPAEVSDEALAQCFQAINDNPQAEQHYLRALEAKPRDPSLVRRVADFYLSIDDASKAEPLLKRLAQERSEDQSESVLITSKDDRSWARRKLALIYGLRAGTENFRRAEELIAANTELGGSSPEDKRVLAIIYGNRHDKPSRKKAISLLEQVISQQSDFSLDDHFLLATFFNQIGDWERYGPTMRSVLDQGGAKNPNYVRYHATALVNKGETVEAEPWIRRLLTLAPGDKTTDLAVFEWLFRSQDYARMLALLQATAEDRVNWPWSAELAETFGTKIMRKGLTSEAEPFLVLAAKLYAQIIEAEPDDNYILTAFQARQGQFEQAFERLSDPDISPDILATIGQMALQSGQLSEEQAQRLIALTSAALEQNPDNVQLGLCVADLHSWVGSWSEATKVYKALLTAQPDSIPVLNNMAMMFAMSGQRLDVASRAIDRAIDKLGETDVLLDTRGMVRLAAGRPGLAEEDFRASFEASASVDRLFHLAQALHAQDEIEEARSVFQQAQEDGLSEHRLHRQERVAFQRLASQL